MIKEKTIVKRHKIAVELCDNCGELIDQGRIVEVRDRSGVLTGETDIVWKQPLTIHNEKNVCDECKFLCIKK